MLHRSYHDWTLLEDEPRLDKVLARCKCGKERRVLVKHLKSGASKGCGCAQAVTHTSHGMTGTPTYNSWHGMRSRCDYPRHRSYPNYGGRGIRVCKRWQSFDLFLKDMGPRPEGMTLDRYPNIDGNYEPGNCRWATGSEQATNKGSR